MAALAGWSCSECTFAHQGAHAEYLACAVCGTQRSLRGLRAPLGLAVQATARVPPGAQEIAGSSAATSVPAVSSRASGGPRTAEVASGRCAAKRRRVESGAPVAKDAFAVMRAAHRSNRLDRGTSTSTSTGEPTPATGDGNGVVAHEHPELTGQYTALGFVTEAEESELLMWLDGEAGHPFSSSSFNGA